MKDNHRVFVSEIIHKNDKFLEGIERDKRLEHLSRYNIATKDGKYAFSFAYWCWRDISIAQLRETMRIPESNLFGQDGFYLPEWLIVSQLVEDTLRCLKCSESRISRIYTNREDYQGFLSAYGKTWMDLQQNPSTHIKSIFMCVSCVNTNRVIRNDNGYIPYKEYILSPEWQAIRLIAIENAKGRCQLCYSPDNLQVHHRTYERLGREDLSDLTVLCRDCHAKFHGKEGE